MSRIVPHIANFTPVLALCLWVGHINRGHVFFWALPLAALFASDAFLGFYPGWAFNYICFAGILFLGQFLSGSLGSFIGGGLAAALGFFIVSNAGVWAFTDLYAKSLDGLILALEAGLPFFRNTLISTLFYSVLVYFAQRYLVQSFDNLAVKRLS